MPTPTRPIINAGGRDGIRLINGQNVADMAIVDVGNGAVRIDRPVAKVTVRNLTVSGGYRVVENLASQGLADASFDGLLVENVTATKLKRGFARFSYQSRKGVLRNIKAQGTVFNDAIPCGIAFMDHAHDFSIEDCDMRGFRMEMGPDAYWNGDGYSSEKDNYGLRFLRCSAWDCTDGGFDLKSTGTFLDGCVAGRNKYNYRFWSTIDAHVITSLAPQRGGGRGHYGHFSLTADQGDNVLHIGKLIVRAQDQAPIFTAHRGITRIIVESHDIAVPRGTPLVEGEGRAEIVWKTRAPVI